MNIIAQVAQTAPPILPSLTWSSALIIYGPMGAMLVWFATRGERLARDVINELGVLGHRINGMTRAMLTDVASRETTGLAVKALVHDELKKLDDEKEVRELRARRK